MTIFRIAVEIDGQAFEKDVLDEVVINTDVDALNTALAENPAKFAWWATLEVLAKRRLAEAKSATELRRKELERELEVLDAGLFQQYQGKLTPGPRGGPTLDAIHAAVSMDEEHVARVLAMREELATMEEAVRQCVTEADLLGVGRAALGHRRDSLLAIGCNLRAEMEHGLFVAKKTVDDFYGGKK